MDHERIERIKWLIAVIEHDATNPSSTIAFKRIADYARNLRKELEPVLENKCECLSELADDAYSPGGPMSGKQKPICKVHLK